MTVMSAHSRAATRSSTGALLPAGRVVDVKRKTRRIQFMSLESVKTIMSWRDEGAQHGSRVTIFGECTDSHAEHEERSRDDDERDQIDPMVVRSCTRALFPWRRRRHRTWNRGKRPR
jgi:hypothetical protein